jgi:hypothetical protein
MANFNARICIMFSIVGVVVFLLTCFIGGSLPLAHFDFVFVPCSIASCEWTAYVQISLGSPNTYSFKSAPHSNTISISYIYSTSNTKSLWIHNQSLKTSHLHLKNTSKQMDMSWISLIFTWSLCFPLYFLHDDEWLHVLVWRRLRLYYLFVLFCVGDSFFFASSFSSSHTVGRSIYCGDR